MPFQSSIGTARAQASLEKIAHENPIVIATLKKATNLWQEIYTDCAEIAKAHNFTVSKIIDELYVRASTATFVDAKKSIRLGIRPWPHLTDI